ncbi:hypothetical protein FA15DRAFT_711943 [Coprinopsis marcescibilis]|uniref:Uncharacterized protein n=1 Tax=Coprinopsis marcescibilis TaxID=230819 RepID=A0A5C3K9T1_COPMA|nr:hypothetical protein FA15DRAFT_711943 [Coprinopsis marcescibilis]
MAQCILGHAPLGEYHARFNIDGEIQCSKTGSPRRLGELMDFLWVNPRTFAFEAPPEGIG